MIFKEEQLQRNKERQDEKRRFSARNRSSCKTNQLANLDPPLANEDSVNATFVEKQQTLLENGLPPETIMSLVENENYGAHKVDEKDLMKNTVCMKNDEPKFA